MSAGVPRTGRGNSPRSWRRSHCRHLLVRSFVRCLQHIGYHLGSQALRSVPHSGCFPGNVSIWASI
eukprot:7534230-Pyramimonas_sp.AAC.1